MKAVRSILFFIAHLIECCLVAAAVPVLVLMILGIRPYAVITGSMEPAIPQGSVCFVNQRTGFDEIRPGDVIAFRSGEMMVTHRAVSVSPDAITTKGDANNTEDAGFITRNEYIGKILFRIPGLGNALLFLKTKRGNIICADVFLFLAAVWFWENRLHKKQNRKENEGSL